jgi:hypothetical protein
MNRNRIIVLIAAIALFIVAAAAPAAYAGLAERGRTETLSFDVAEDMTRFVFDKDVVYAEDGMPADGSSFITRGYLYPAGTLTCEDGACDGVNEDGSPQFPDKLIGEWICSGYMINDAAHATSGVWVFSTQFFQLGTEPGAETIVSTGYELADLGVAIQRATTGGTGAYADARGQGEQTLLGFNAGQGVSLSVKLDVRVR